MSVGRISNPSYYMLHLSEMQSGVDLPFHTAIGSRPEILAGNNGLGTGERLTEA